MKILIKAGKTIVLLGLTACLLLSMTVSAFAEETEPAPQGDAVMVIEVGGGPVPSAEATSAANTLAEQITASGENTVEVDVADGATVTANTVELTDVIVDSTDASAPVDGLEFEVDVKVDGAAIAEAPKNTKVSVTVTTEGAFVPGRVDQAGTNGTSLYFYMKGNTTDTQETITSDSKVYTYGGTFSYVGNVISFDSSLATSTVIVHEALATVGSVGYDTLQGATDAAEAGETVEIQRNGSGDGVVVDANSNIVYDFNNYTYTIDGKLAGSDGTKTNGFQLLKGATVVMNNGTIVGSEKAQNGETGKVCGTKIVIQNYSDLTLNNMNVTGKGSYVLSNNNGTTNIAGSTNVTHLSPSGCAVDCTWWPSAYPDGSQVIINTTGTVTGNIEMGMYGKQTADKTAYVDFVRPSESVLTINNVKHNGAIIQWVSATGTYGTGLTQEENEQLFTDSTIINGGAFKEALPSFVTVNGKIGETTIEGVKYTTVNAPEIPAAPAAPAAVEAVEVPTVSISSGGTAQVIDLAAGTQNGAEMPVIKAEITAAADTEEAKAVAAQIVVREVVVDDMDAEGNVEMVFTVARIEDGKSITLTEPVVLSIPVGNTDLDGYVLCYIDESGNKVELEYEVIDGKIVFKTTFVGVFMLVKA